MSLLSLKMMIPASRVKLVRNSTHYRIWVNRKEDTRGGGAPVGVVKAVFFGLGSSFHKSLVYICLFLSQSKTSGRVQKQKS